MTKIDRRENLALALEGLMIDEMRAVCRTDNIRVHSDVWRVKTWSNVTWIGVSGITKFWWVDGDHGCGRVSGVSGLLMDVDHSFNRTVTHGALS